MSTTSTDMASLITTLQGEPGFDATRIPGVRLMRAEQAYPRSPVFYEPRICILAQGQKIGFLGGETYRYDAERYLVMSVPLPFECETHASAAEPLLGVSVDVEIGTLKELLLQMEEAPGSDDDNELAPSAPMASVPLDAGMADACCAACRARWTAISSARNWSARSSSAPCAASRATPCVRWPAGTAATGAWPGPCGASTPTTPVRWTSTPWLARRT